MRKCKGAYTINLFLVQIPLRSSDFLKGKRVNSSILHYPAGPDTQASIIGWVSNGGSGS